jgi:hypothetical protein
MKIAIIGSGFFGATLGLVLSKKHIVTIYEKEKTILQGASAANQFRFHLGYHYPRSKKTITEINKSKKLFTSFNGNGVFQKTINYYLIAKKSKTNFTRYRLFLKKNRLYNKKIDILNFSHEIDEAILSNEKILNYFKYKKSILQKIKKSKLKLKLSTEFKKKDLISYDKVIIATYSNNNSVLKKLGVKKLQKYKFELVEKIIIKLPKRFSNKSYVVVDGKFVCVDPYLGTNYHLLSDVKLSKLETKIGNFPIFKDKKKKYLNKGMIKNIKASRFNQFINRSSIYLPFLNEAKYIGSFFVIRTIQKDKEKTDERVSSIISHSKKITSILSGKWNNCVYLAQNFLINKRL